MFLPLRDPIAQLKQGHSNHLWGWKEEGAAGSHSVKEQGTGQVEELFQCSHYAQD